MFLAIINDTYSEVKGDMANQMNEFEMTDYFKRVAMHLIRLQKRNLCFNKSSCGLVELHVILLKKNFVTFLQGYQKMVDKLNLKRDKIQDIHETLKHADINGDDKLDFDEWRQDLKT